MEKMNVNKNDQNKSNLSIINKNNYHEKLTEFKSIINNDSYKIIVLNLIDSLNLNYSKLFDKLTSNMKQAPEANFFSDFFFPKATEKWNSQILFLEITILLENPDSNGKRDSETFIIPSIKFHKFISESYLNLNPSLLNFFSNNRSIFPLKALLDIDTLSYMPNSVDSHLLKNFEKIRKFGKPTKNEYKKSYYFFPKGLNDPVINTKNKLEDFFKSLNSKVIEIKNDEKKILEYLAQNKPNPQASADKFYFKDKFSVEKVLDFKYMYFFKKYDENFLKMYFSKFRLESLLAKEEIRQNKHIALSDKDLVQVNFTVQLLKKVMLDLEFVSFKIYDRLGFKNEKIDEHYEKVLKSAFKDLYSSANENKNLPFFRLNLPASVLESIESGLINEIYFTQLSEFLSKCLNQKIIFLFEHDNFKNGDCLELKYFLTQAPSNESLIYFDLLKEVIVKLVRFLESNPLTVENQNQINPNSQFTDDYNELIKMLYIKTEKKSITNIKSSILNNKNPSVKNNNEPSDRELPDCDSSNFEIDLAETLKKLSEVHSIDAEMQKSLLNYEIFACLEYFLPKNFLNNFTPTYEVTVDYNLSCLGNIDPKRIENDKVSYDVLFLKINKEKDILFDYDIETAIYKFLEHDVIQALRRNGQLDYLYYNRMTSEMKKFYADLKSFLYYDNDLKFKKRLENEVFGNTLINFSFANDDKISYDINQEALPNKKLFEFLDNLEQEKTLLEMKNGLLMLFNETKAEFLIKEEYGLYNFVEALFGSKLKNSLIAGIDVNSILIKLFNELYINHNIIFKDNQTLEGELAEEFKNIFVEKFLSKSYLDLNYVFNNQKTLELFKINEKDFHDILNAYLDNIFLKGRLEKTSSLNDSTSEFSLKTITRNIASFIEKRLIYELKLGNLDNLMLKLKENSCLNNFFLAKNSNVLSHTRDLKLFQIKDAKEITLSLVQESISDGKKNKVFVIKYDKIKKKILVQFLRKFADFYVCDLKDNLTRIEFCDEMDDTDYKNFTELLLKLDLLT